jgi:hypothetical protein
VIDALRRRRKSVPHAPRQRRRRRGGVRRYPWAELLRRVFEVEVLVCPHCAVTSVSSKAYAFGIRIVIWFAPAKLGSSHTPSLA